MKKNEAVPSALDLLGEKVANMLKSESVSLKLETVVHYLYKRKELPFALSETQEVELFELMTRVTDKNEAYAILREYKAAYGIKSLKAKELFESLSRSFEIYLSLKEEERGVGVIEEDDEEAEDANSLMNKLSDEDLIDIIEKGYK